MIKKITLLFMFTIFFHVIVFASGDDNTGASDFQFLKMDVTARSLALGGAFGAVSDDLSAIRYNPAGLRFLVRPEISATHVVWIEDFRSEYLGYARPIGTNKAIGFSLFHIGLGEDLLGRDEDGFVTGNLKFSQSVFLISGATKLDRYDNYLLGANLKYAKEVLDYSEKVAMAMDMGLLIRIYRNVLLGTTIRNVGIGVSNLPVEQRIALSIVRRKVGFSLDAYKFSDTGVRYAFGMEYLIKDFFAARLGYNTSLRSLGDLLEYESMSSFSEYSVSGLSIGFGLLSNPIGFMGGNELKFDYAIVNYGKFGFTHIFTLSMEL
ncbi:MAG: UPF0164 family protein [bacterium]|nr:UPF0164 family protein [bacterium]